MIKRLLVANRGEIAVRIMATASVLGIETVAVYPADDAACGHVGRADAAVELPGAGAAAYLDVDAIIAAATGAGCDMVHPGYGFLSERPELAAPVRRGRAALRRTGGGSARAVRRQGRGPGPGARAGRARPGRHRHRSTSRSRCSPCCVEHGAVMIKAVAGGGGRGLRPVTREEDLAEAMRRCASEAAAAFGDGRVYAERLLSRARHVEVQVVGDGTGAVAVLGDRDCSLQRRRQKLVEIAPARADRRGPRPAVGGRGDSSSARPATRAWPPPNSWSRTTRSPSSRSTPGCRSSTRSPNRSPGWTWSRSGCASPTALCWLTSAWARSP